MLEIFGARETPPKTHCGSGSDLIHGCNIQARTTTGTSGSRPEQRLQTDVHIPKNGWPASRLRPRGLAAASNE